MGPQPKRVSHEAVTPSRDGQGAAVTTGGDDRGDQEQAVGDEGNHRVAEAEPRAMEETGGAEGNGVGGDDTWPSQTPPRDSAKGKGAVIDEETAESPVPYREEDVVCRPVDNPIIGEFVLKAKDERARAIEASEAAERAERERAGPEGLAADIEAEERAVEEAQGLRVRAVDEAGAMVHSEFSAEAYMFPTPHLFVPSGFQAYKTQQPEYDSELVLRDPRVHIANTWAEV
ncbi:hypothetical protein RHMOL_Rhmol02G0158600 [Rhododendron molle]|uniref:Uncharacterized protein n=1 Tax=Rhododendron molle TaxID=49168 RepID=A0ACC0PQB0_RHOML|nr:hypothetical protein RHMOL_Rhmol02G0158600 [Rhododendron molle]